MEPYTQRDFSGGLNLFDFDHNVEPNQYVLGFNARTRFNGFSCVKKPLEDLKAPKGKKQGLYGFADFLLLFVSGRAYYKNTALVDGEWVLIPNVVLDREVDRIYAQAVPATPSGFGRKLREASVINSAGSDTRVDVSTRLAVLGVDVGVVVQDGVSQPYFIYQSGDTAAGKRIQKYPQWTFQNREYVPIGKQMAFVNGVLFVVSPDGKQLYRSVTLRPLDFVVAVDEKGEKQGDATTTAYPLSSNPITMLRPTSGGGILVGTIDGCFVIEFDYNFLVFGEPTFLNRQPFSAGIVNQFSFAENLGDYTFIDVDGIRSFNAISSVQNEGRNSVFSRNVSRLFQNLNQTDKTCATLFDNYCFYSVETVFGPAVLVFDTLRQVWVSLDFYGIGTIKQFASTKQNLSPTLYAITQDSVFELFGSEEFLEAEVYPRALISGHAQAELIVAQVRAIFSDSMDEAIVKCTPISDDLEGESVRQRLKSRRTGIMYPVAYSIFYNKPTQKVENLIFDFQFFGKVGVKAGAKLSWASSANLILFQIDLQSSTSHAPETRKASSYVN